LDSVGEWEGFVEELVSDLASGLRRRLYRVHVNRLRGLGAPSEKLVYIYLVLAEPQSFSTARRSLGIGKATLSRALVKLRGLEYVELDDFYLYWVKE